MNEMKTSYEKKCLDYERIIEEKDVTIETLQLDLVVIKEAVKLINIWNFKIIFDEDKQEREWNSRRKTKQNYFARSTMFFYFY